MNREQYDLAELFNLGQKNKKNLILFNDDVNNFSFVIESLIKVCEHNNEQAAQCAFIAHTKGKCEVKTGEYEQLRTMKNALTSRGLNVTIQ